MQTLHYCFWPRPTSVNRRVSPCCTGETCFWSVTHAACWTMWNHSSVSSCQSARRPAILSERALQAVSMLSQRANLQTAAFSIRSGFWRCGYFFSYIFERGGSDRIRGMGRQGCSWTCNVPRTQRYSLCTGLLATKSWIMHTEICCPWRRLEGHHGLWGQNQSDGFLN